MPPLAPSQKKVIFLLHPTQNQYMVKKIKIIKKREQIASYFNDLLIRYFK